MLTGSENSIHWFRWFQYVDIMFQYSGIWVLYTKYDQQKKISDVNNSRELFDSKLANDGTHNFFSIFFLFLFVGLRFHYFPKPWAYYFLLHRHTAFGLTPSKIIRFCNMIQCDAEFDVIIRSKEKDYIKNGEQ